MTPTSFTLVTRSRRELMQHVDVLVEELVGPHEGLYLVQRADRKLAVVRYESDIDPMAPTAEEALGRVRWFDRDLIAGALVTANVRPLVDPDRQLSFLGACAVSLGLVEHKEATGLQLKLDKTTAKYREALKHLERMTPTRKHAAQARGFLRAHGGLERRADR